MAKRSMRLGVEEGKTSDAGALLYGLGRGGQAERRGDQEEIVRRGWYISIGLRAGWIGQAIDNDDLDRNGRRPTVDTTRRQRNLRKRVVGRKSKGGPVRLVCLSRCN